MRFYMNKVLFSLCGFCWLFLTWLALEMAALWAVAFTALWSATTAITEASWWSWVKNLSFCLAECCWCCVCWKAEEVTEVFNSLVCECEVCVGPCVWLLCESLWNEGSADLEWVDVEASEFWVHLCLVIRNAHYAVLEEVTEDFAADLCWHIHC